MWCGAQPILCGRSSDRVVKPGEEPGAPAHVVDESHAGEPAHLTTEAEWSATISANLTTAFRVVRAGVRPMMQSGGSIVLVSTAARVVRNIRVNCVAAGLVDTPLTAGIIWNDPALVASLGMRALERRGALRATQMQVVRQNERGEAA